MNESNLSAQLNQELRRRSHQAFCDLVDDPALTPVQLRSMLKMQYSQLVQTKAVAADLLKCGINPVDEVQSLQQRNHELLATLEELTGLLDHQRKTIAIAASDMKKAHLLNLMMIRLYTLPQS